MVDVTGLKFVVAKTMPNIPHEYVVRNMANNEKYEELYYAVKNHGVWEKFGRRSYQYLYLGDGYKYWTMTDDINQSKIINRAKVTE